MKSKKIVTLITTATIVGSFCIPGLSAFADQFNVMSIGANLNAQQKQEMVKYFNAKPGSYEEVTINNQQEQQELKGIVPESEIGTRTISCAFVQPTQSGGINVKTANLTYVTASMITNALTTAGIYNANVIAAAPFQVSGTGALTGIMTSFEKATGQTISPQKKELANKELEVTSKIASDPNVGQTKASAVVNDVKAKVVQNGNQDQSQIASTINNVANNYGVKLTPEQTQQLADLMSNISKQDYNKEAMEKSLDKIQDQLNKVLDEQGQLNGMMNKLEVHWDSFVNWFEGIFSGAKKDATGIINQTDNNTTIGKTAVTTGNNDSIKDAAPTPSITSTPQVTSTTETNNNQNTLSSNTKSTSTNTQTTKQDTNQSTTASLMKSPIINNSIVTACAMNASTAANEIVGLLPQVNSSFKSTPQLTNIVTEGLENVITPDNIKSVVGTEPNQLYLIVGTVKSDTQPTQAGCLYYNLGNANKELSGYYAVIKPVTKEVFQTFISGGNKTSNKVSPFNVSNSNS